jgi:hypothetical protein
VIGFKANGGPHDFVPGRMKDLGKMRFEEQVDTKNQYEIVSGEVDGVEHLSN